MALRAVATTSVSRATISEPIPVRTRTQARAWVRMGRLLRRVQKERSGGPAGPVAQVGEVGRETDERQVLDADERGDVADPPVGRQLQHLDDVAGVHAALLVEGVGAERELAVDRHRQEAPAAPVREREQGEEVGDGVRAAEPAGPRRHRDRGVLGQQRPDGVDVAALPGVDVARREGRAAARRRAPAASPAGASRGAARRSPCAPAAAGCRRPRPGRRGLLRPRAGRSPGRRSGSARRAGAAAGAAARR